MKTNFKPPFLSEKDVDSAADELIAKWAKKSKQPVAPPVPVEDILEKLLGLTIEFKDMEELLGEPGILGGTWIAEGVVRFDRSLEHGTGRYFFTVAHELGHWQLHRPQMILAKEMPVLFQGTCVEGPPPNIVCRSGAKEPIETQADMFAASLLMPKALMRQSFSRLFPSGLRMPAALRSLEQNAADRVTWMNDIATHMVQHGGFSNCSREAMRYRLEAMKLVNCTGLQPLF